MQNRIISDIDPYGEENWNDDEPIQNEDNRGYVFVPYLMAQSISIISEGNSFTPKKLIRSRYKLATL